MNKEMFLRRLFDGLAGLPEREIDDIMDDYSAYFDEGAAAGRSEENVAAALGDPARLARELRAETGLRRWEGDHSLRNSAAALLALGGLAAVDALLLLPLLFAAGLIVLVLGFVTFILRVIGIGALLNVFRLADVAPISKLVLHTLFGIGLIFASVVVTMLLWFAIKGAVDKVGGIARLHCRLLKPRRPAT